MSSVHRCRVEARSYELDGFGHLNHAVFLNYFEYARFRTLMDRGFAPEDLRRRNEGIHVVRIEVDYRKEVMLGRELEIRTRLDSLRNSSMILEQTACLPEDPEVVFAAARVVLVWVGPDRRPIRIPDDVRTALTAA